MSECVGDSILRGVGDHSFCSFRKKICLISINGLNLELEFLIVPDHYIQYEILLGENLFDIPGLQIIFSKSQIKISIHTNRLWYWRGQQAFTRVIRISFWSFYIYKFGKYWRIVYKTPDETVQRRPYCLAPIERENVIRDSNSPSSSTIQLVRKKDGSDRLCVDFKELNSNTVRDNFPLPLIEDYIGKLVNAKYFTVLDMVAGSHQIPIAPDSIESYICHTWSAVWILTHAFWAMVCSICVSTGYSCSA